MHPSEVSADSPESERYVFAKLRDGLPDSVCVVHARRVVIPARDRGRAEDAEVDFLLLDPERGLLGLEVKGGGVRRAPEGWFQRGRDGVERRIADPGAQAQRAVHAIDRYLRDQDAPRIPFGWGVVLPDVDVRGALGPDLPRELVIDRLSFSDVPAAVARVFDANGLRGARIDEPVQRAFVRAIAPTVHLVAPLARRFEREADALLRLTDEQAGIIDALEAMPRVAIEGAAGTGKTLLAVEWARRIAAQGRRALLLCFNRPLADHLGSVAEGYDVQSFHGLCHDLAQEADIEFRVPESAAAQQRFWSDEAPLRLLESLDRLPERRWDAVIVDEGQDFRENWWAAIEELLREPRSGSLVVFYDPNQDIYGGGPPKYLGVAPARLVYNCRNTARIASWVARCVGAEARFRPGTPDGLEVGEIECRDEAALVQNVRTTLHELLHDGKVASEQIVVLSTRSPEKSCLARHRRLGSITLVPLSEAAGPGRVRFGSLHRFKGLEADVVLLVVEPGALNSGPKHLYVGGSRARLMLVVMKLAG
jgi:hypothetical protein